LLRCEATPLTLLLPRFWYERSRRRIPVDSGEYAGPSCRERQCPRFRVSHREWLERGRSHFGIPIIPQQRYSTGEIVRRILRLNSSGFDLAGGTAGPAGSDDAPLTAASGLFSE
jgi:hypothetical protein